MINSNNISQIISYQKGAVVSKEIVKKPTGTITLFAFDKDQGLSEHTAPFDAFILIVDGIAEIIVSNIKHEVEAGEILLIPGNAPHSLKAITPFKMILTMIRS